MEIQMQFAKKPPPEKPSPNRLFDPLMDTEEAAALLQIHAKTLQRTARRGQVKAFQLGKLWRFRASDLVQGMTEIIAS